MKLILICTTVITMFLPLTVEGIPGITSSNAGGGRPAGIFHPSPPSKQVPPPKKEIPEDAIIEIIDGEIIIIEGGKANEKGTIVSPEYLDLIDRQ